jgi:hypothetical protein
MSIPLRILFYQYLFPCGRKAAVRLDRRQLHYGSRDVCVNVYSDTINMRSFPLGLWARSHDRRLTDICRYLFRKRRT